MAFKDVLSIRNHNVQYTLEVDNEGGVVYRVTALLDDKRYKETYQVARHEFDETVMFLTLDHLVDTLDEISKDG